MDPEKMTETKWLIFSEIKYHFVQSGDKCDPLSEKLTSLHNYEFDQIKYIG